VAGPKAKEKRIKKSNPTPDLEAIKKKAAASLKVLEKHQALESIPEYKKLKQELTSITQLCEELISKCPPATQPGPPKELYSTGQQR